jgi:hypothetical protein
VEVIVGQPGASPEYTKPGGVDGPTIIMIADGWTRSVFLRLLGDGELPEIAEGLVASGGLLTNVVSNLPSVSIASHASILTSSYQDQHGLPGHRWLDGETNEVRNYLTPRGPFMANRDLASDISTIYESRSDANTYSVQGIINRGAQHSVHVPSMHARPILARTARIAMRHPDAVIVSWLPRIDALSHTRGPESRKVEQDMVNTSRAIGRLLGSLEAQGTLDRARILLIPDHGHREVHHAARLEDVLKNAGVIAAVNPRRSTIGPLALTSGDSAAYLYLDERQRAERSAIALAICRSPNVELVCWMDSGRARFTNKNGGSLLSPSDHCGGTYSILDGMDPLGILSGEAQSEYLDLTAPMIDRGYYPDILHQFLRSHIPGRSGDMLIMAAPDVHFGRGPRLGWRFGYHRGSHGGPFEDEVMVAAAHRGMRFNQDIPIRSADLLRSLGALTVRRSGYAHASPRG